VIRALGGFAVLLLAAGCGLGDGALVTDVWRSAMGETCGECHARISPGLVADHDSNKGGVPPTVCAKCHEEAMAEFAASRHGQRLKGGKLDALLEPQMTATGGCTATNGCHTIQQVYPDQSVGRCGTCHVTHAFRAESARNPQVCHVADCVECHTAHDVSGGITHGLSPFPTARLGDIIPRVEVEEFVAARAVMVARCRNCHSQRFAVAALDRADWWRVRGAQMLEAAAAIVRDLHRDGLLDPPLEDRPRNPVAAHGLRLGGLQIFDGSTSMAERIYYEMYFQHYPALWRASYHTDPERVTWHANDALKSALDRLRAIDRERRRYFFLAEPKR